MTEKALKFAIWCLAIVGLFALFGVYCGHAHAAYNGPVTVTLPANAHVSTLSAPGEGGDYTEPNAWIADYITGKDLVSLDVTEVLQLRAGVYDFTINIPATATTDTDHRIIIMAYPGEECTGPTVGARVVWTAADAGEAIQLYNSWCYIYNIGVSKPNGAGSPTCGGAWVGAGGGNPMIAGGGIYGVYAWDIRNSAGNAAGIELQTVGGVIDHCYAENVSSTGSTKGLGTTSGSDDCAISNSEAYSIASSSAVPTDVASAIMIYVSSDIALTNCVGHKAVASNGSGVGVLLAASTGVSVRNSTFALNQLGCYSYASAATAVNVASEQNTTVNWFTYAGGSWAQTTCTDGGGVTFVDAAGGDFQLAAADTVARDQGTTVVGVTTDYLDVTRPQGSAYDIGAYEYPVAAAPGCFVFFIW